MSLLNYVVFLWLLVSGGSLASAEDLAVQKRATCPEKYAQYQEKHIRCYDDDPDAQEVTLTQEVKDAIVAKHNELRGKVNPSASNMQTMIWDDTLAETARKWAMQCKPMHDRNHQEPDWPGVAVSQNAARQHKDAHPSTKEAFMDAIQAFYDEVDNGAYTYGVPYDTPSSGPGAGHYLTMVHALSNRVGCGEAHCPTKYNDLSYYQQRHYFQICNYAYGNNWTLPYTKGDPCSDCPGHCDTTGKLCDCKGKLCFNGGKVNLNTCQCDCTDKFEGEQCEKRKCPKEEPSWCGRNDHAQCSYNTWLQDTCPQFCDLCPKPCGGKTCLHSGKLDVDSCTCVCNTPRFWTVYTGDTCEVCPTEDFYKCQYKSKDDCTSSDYSASNYMDRYCPIMCGKC